MKITPKQKKELRLMLDALMEQKEEIVKQKDALPENEDTGGMPSEVEAYKGLTYKQVIEKALEAEKEAIFLGLYAIELAPDKDIKSLVEITNDENDHSGIYQRILDRLMD